MIPLVLKAAKKTLTDGSIHQLDGAVVAEEHAGRDVGDRGLNAGGDAAHALQELVLLVRDAGFFSGELAEVKELAQLKTKFGKAAQLRGVDGRGRSFAS